MQVRDLGELSPLFETALVLARLNHVASVIVNGITASCERLRYFAHPIA